MATSGFYPEGAILASSIFLIMFVLIVTEKYERHWVTLGSGVATIVLVFGIGMSSIKAAVETLSLSQIFTSYFWYHRDLIGDDEAGINWPTIFFIAGMMVMVEGMAESGFLRWLCMMIAKWTNYKAFRIFIAFMILSAVLSMFIDSITVVLFLVAITIQLSRDLLFNPMPMILAEIFCANLGGAATMCGDPPNVIIGTALGYNFKNFIMNTGVIAGICLVVVVIYFSIVFRHKLDSKPIDIELMKQKLNPADAIEHKKMFAASVIIFIVLVILLITHASTGLTMPLIGVIAAIATLIATPGKQKKILRNVDYKTLLFFIGLFVVVGGLEQTGSLEVFADFIGHISGGNNYILLGIILVVSAVASAFVDNIPFSATMIPVIKSLAILQGIDLATMAWALALGTDIGGSATPIGASANVVGISVAQQNGIKISWAKYCIHLVPATALVIAMSLVYVYVRYL